MKKMKVTTQCFKLSHHNNCRESIDLLLNNFNISHGGRSFDLNMFVALLFLCLYILLLLRAGRSIVALHQTIKALNV